MSDPVNTAADTTEAPVLQVPPKDTINEATSVTAPATGSDKVTPIQRLSSVYNKAKQSVTDAVSEANKAINEKKTAKPTAEEEEEEAAAAAAETTATACKPSNDKKVGASNIAFKDLLARVKGLAKPTSTHPAPVEASSTSRDEAGPPVPPKDNIKSTNTDGNPIMDQFKRNATLLANYINQKKKDFAKKSSSEATQKNEQHHTTAAPDVHHVVDTATQGNTTSASPLVRRITKLVHTINKKKDQYTKKEARAEAITTEPVAVAPATTVA